MIQTPCRHALNEAWQQDGHLGVALYLANLGFKVFPIHTEGANAKHPCDIGWQKLATSDPQRIRGHLWAGQARCAGVGLATGTASGILVFGLDTKDGKDGVRRFDALGPATATLNVRTPSGGVHRYYIMPEEHFTIGANVADGGQGQSGIDFRANGGYVVAPGTKLSAVGDYQIVDEAPIAPLPPHLRALLTAAKQRRGNGDAIGSGTIPSGGRNSTLTQIAGRLVGQGRSTAEVREELLRINREQCRPPLEASEVEGIVLSSDRWERGYADHETGDADRLVDRVGASMLRHMGDKTRQGWRAWVDDQWDPEGWPHALEAVKRHGRELAMEADKEPHQDRAKRLRCAAHRIGKRPERVLELAATSPKVHVKPEVFAPKPYILPVRNGILDLKTGRLRPACLEDYAEVSVPHAYDEQAQCPLFDRFARDITGRDDEVAGFLQRYLGSALAWDPKDQTFLQIEGAGGTGKGTLVRILQATLGRMATTLAPGALAKAQRDGTGPDEELHSLRFARMAFVNETAEGVRLDAEKIKTLTGQDTISARGMYGPKVTFEARSRFLFSSNFPLVFDGSDTGMERRFSLLEFNCRPDKPDRDLSSKIMASELPGVLTWLVRGCREWMTNGLGAPASVVDATRAYLASLDNVGRFLNEACVEHNTVHQVLSLLYSSYQSWCSREGLKAMSQQSFRQKLERKGFGVRPGHARQLSVHGLALRPPGWGMSVAAAE